MDALARIESSLADAVLSAEASGAPPRLAAAMRHAVFPKGARIRPRLTLAVAAACGDDQPRLSSAAAAAIELLHCASLVHDDLPCFDDADTRRGRPSVHRAFGEPLAVLAGDGLIVLAFQTVARAGCGAPERLGPVINAIGDGVGVPFGIVAGQAWECEPRADLSEYQRQKTGALFAAASMPILPLAPERFSITQGCGVLRLTRSARMRPTKSVDPPGGKGRMMRTGRSGTQPCAMASPGRQRAKRLSAIRRSMGVPPDSLGSGCP